jgi:hypothetical protein
MNNETGANNPSLHTLIPLEDFKAILGLDDREDCLDFASVRNQGYEFSQSENSTHLFQPPSLAAFCLTTATYTIEQYCRRRLYLKRHFERIEFHGDLFLPLGEYPVREMLAVYVLGQFGETGELIEPDLYRVIPDLEEETGEKPEDTVYSLSFSPALKMPSLAFSRLGVFAEQKLQQEQNHTAILGGGRGLSVVKAVYMAGYACGEAGDPYGVPADLASACLELAAWNMTRYRGRRIGMTGNVRGNGKDGEHLEASMPENVRLLLEPYRRRVI